MEKETFTEDNQIDHKPSDIQEIDGVKYRLVDTGYTLKQYYSHSTLDKGPGPGWDWRWPVLKKYGVDDPSLLPDEPYYTWEEIVEE